MELLQDLRSRLGAVAQRAGADIKIEDADFAKRGAHLEVIASAACIVDVARCMDEAGFTMELVTGVDYLAEQAVEVVYDFNRMTQPCRVTIRVRVPRDAAKLPTISAVFGGADWHEREAHEMFGIVFEGHPNLAPLLLPEDATFHPLRKDYAP